MQPQEPAVGVCEGASSQQLEGGMPGSGEPPPPHGEEAAPERPAGLGRVLREKTWDETGLARTSSLAPAKKIKAKIKKTLPVTGPQAPTLHELMHWYCMNTNTHGCRRIVVSRGRLRRCLWILLTLTAVGLILWYCAQLVMNYYVASVSVTVHFHKLPFPAVTICNINPYKYSAIKGHLAELDKETMAALRSLYNFSESKPRDRRDAGSEKSDKSKFLKHFPLRKMDYLHPTSVANFSAGHKRRIDASINPEGPSMVKNPQDIVGFQLCDSNNKSDCALYTFSSGVNAIQEWYKLHYMNIMAQIDAEEKVRMSYSADELLLSCFFDGNSCDSRNFTSFHHPMHGNCYTFNSGQNGEILNTSTGGSENGLQVILYIEEADYNPFLVMSTGAKIVVHDQNEYPFIEDIGTEIETGIATSIGMHFTKSHRLSKPYSNCTENGAGVQVENLYNKTYSLQICLHSCFQNSMVKNCGCAQYAQPLPAGAEFCNYKKFPNWMYCYYKLHEQFVKEQLDCQQICKEACRLKEWTLTTSLAQWPSTVSEEWMLRVLSWDKGKDSNKMLNKTDLANLMVFYKDLNERSITEKPTNTVVLLLSNFGGQLGLWMSCSVVCVIEIVEVFFIDTLCIILRHQWQKVKKWWQSRKGGRSQEATLPPQSGTLEGQGHDNPACTQDDDDDDDDLPTFNTAMRLPLPPQHLAPRTPPPNYSTLRLASPFPEQLEDTLEVRRQ